MGLHTPVLLLFWRRPETLKKVIGALKLVEPSRLFFGSDGYENLKTNEQEKVIESRKIAEKNITWPCEIRQMYFKKHQGCRETVSKSISWFFENTDEGIILEDDCVPSTEFFGFCEMMLKKYKKESRVWSISGTNFQNGTKRGKDFYYFSSYNHIWGWATWKDRWQQYDRNMSFWPAWRKSVDFQGAFRNEAEAKYWRDRFDQTYAGKVDTWDYQWTALIRRARGLNVIPEVNLVTNIGFGEDATHTKDPGIGLSLPTQSLMIDGRASPVIEADSEADQYVFENIFMRKSPSASEDLHPIEAKNNQTSKVRSWAQEKLYLLSLRCLVATPFYQGAFLPLARMKAKGKPRQGIDYLRAKIRQKEGLPGEAVEMLKEELRLHPENRQAQQLLQKLLPQVPVGNYENDNEWGSLIRKIHPFTMLSEARLRALYEGAKKICQEDRPGNFVECGVAAGGSSALLAWVIQKYSRRLRLLYSFDTFAGMPKPTALDTHAGIHAQKTGWGEGTCAAPVDSLLEITGKLNVASLVRPVQGLFQETLPLVKDEIGPIALLHLDGDWYDSTGAILNNLYSQVVNGAYLQVDDYGHWEGCKKAIDEFESGRKLHFTRHRIDDTGIWFSKP